MRQIFLDLTAGQFGELRDSRFSNFFSPIASQTVEHSRGAHILVAGSETEAPPVPVSSEPVILCLSQISICLKGGIILLHDSPLLMVIFLAALIANLHSIFRSRTALALENLALRHQIGVLQRSARKRPKWTPLDRLLWVWLSCIWSDWRSRLVIVQPETVVAWHRKGFRLFWTWKVHR